jgi:hypothetical protein
MFINSITVQEFYERLNNNDDYRNSYVESSHHGLFATYQSETITDVAQPCAGRYTIQTDCNLYTVGPYERITLRKSDDE